MNIRFVIIVFLWCPALIKAQSFRIDKADFPIDSLNKVLPFLHDSARVDCLYELACSYMESLNPGQIDSALIFAKLAYEEASAIQYMKGLGDACVMYATIYKWRYFNPAECEKYFREATIWYEKIHDDNGLGVAYLGTGSTLIMRDADEALKFFDKSVYHLKRSGNKVLLAELIDQYAYVFQAKGNYEKEFEYVRKALLQKESISDKRGIIWSYYRLASIYQESGDSETALNYFRETFRLASNQKIRWRPFRSMGRIFISLGMYDSSFSYFHKMLVNLPADGPALEGLGKLSVLKHDYSNALLYFKNALATYQNTKNPNAARNVLLMIGNVYADSKQYSKALWYARQGLEIDGKRHEETTMRNVYEIYWKTYQGLHKNDSAYFYFKKFIHLRDSIKDAHLKIQYIQKLGLFKVAAKEENQQAKIDLLHKDNQLKNQQLQREGLMKRIFAGSLLCFILLSFFVFRNIILKRRSERNWRELVENELKMHKLETERKTAELNQQASELKMQALRAQMNPHFIFNSLNCINRFILKKQSGEATIYLTKFSRLIRMILNTSINTTIMLSEELAALELYLQLESLRFEEKFVYQILCDPEVDDGFIKVPPMLIQPFVENAIWHGLMLKKEEGHIWINICQQEATLICTITDDGIGRKKSTELKNNSSATHQSMGLRITADRIALLQQQMRQEASVQITDLVLPDGSAGGTEVIIKIPVRYD